MSSRRIVRREAVTVDASAWPASVHPVLRRVYAARGVARPERVAPALAQLLPPATLGGMAAASALLADAITQGRRIVVVGDFDCDGATGVAVGVRGLRLLGATQVGCKVPHRVEHGYGLSPALVDAIAPLRPQLLLTVDHGIACHDGIAAARARGWQVIVTDHHLPGERLPPADAIVNPNARAFVRCAHGMTECDTCAAMASANAAFGSRALAGVGVLFYLLLATRRRLREGGWFEPGPARAEPDLRVLLDLVAVGTVADMVALDDNNRALVAAGLRRLREGACQPGLRALAEVSGRRLERLGSSDIGFAIAPRINAAGRLEDMAIGVECLLADDPQQALELARTLDAINRERRQLQDDMVEMAAAMAGDADAAAGACVCVADPQWHPGVVGLVASRLKERLHRPALAFAPAEPGSELWRGSARSIAGFHIRDALAGLDARQPGLIQRFGGHALAAGLTVAGAELPRFIRAFTEWVQAHIDPALLAATVASDGTLAADEIGLDLASQVQEGGPWGQGFPEPVFDGEFDVRAWRVVGERHLKFELAMGEHRFDAIEFQADLATPPPARVRIAYRLDINEWRQQRRVQLVIVHREPG